MASSFASLLPQLQRAQLLLQQGRGGEAWLVLAPLRPAMDGHGQALRLYALAAQGLGRIDEAASALKRILELEANPPDILGALADMLGQAGRHNEALVHWDRLVALHPELADAHLNRAITAAESGQHDLAIAAADAGLKRFEGHARLLAVKAMALKNAGRIPESVALFEQAVAADPKRPLTRHNQAVALRAACQFDEACEAYAEAERLGMRGAQFHANWAAAELEANHVDEAEKLYQQALADEPEYDEARKGLTRLKIEYRQGEGAFAHYAQAAAAQQSNPKGWLDWVEALVVNRRTDEAALVAERGLAANPASYELQAAHSIAQGMTGDASAALDELEALLAGQPENSPLATLIPELALRADRPERAAELLERRTAQDPADQLAWAMLSLAWRMLGDSREHWLCDYDRLVMVTDVVPPDGRKSPADFARDVAATLDPLHVTTAEPGDQTLRGGTQTSGALFARPDPAIQLFRTAVENAAAQMVAQLPEDESHPFLRRKSVRFGFSGSWSVRLRAGGFHVAHMHSQGWMSSAYYARLPVTDPDTDNPHAGWIQFGVPPERLGLETMAPRRIVEPQPGRLVLFPSYLWHGTIPFSGGDRLTAAFDYLPI